MGLILFSNKPLINLKHASSLSIILQYICNILLLDRAHQFLPRCLGGYRKSLSLILGKVNSLFRQQLVSVLILVLVEETAN